jgi:hypothetical protein
MAAVISPGLLKNIYKYFVVLLMDNCLNTESTPLQSVAAGPSRAHFAHTQVREAPPLHRVLSLQSLDNRRQSSASHIEIGNLIVQRGYALEAMK